MKDAVIILSHRLESGKISEEYKKRLEKGAELILNKKARKIILCSETANNNVKGILIKKGIKEEDILLQKESRDTIGEAFFTKKQILAPNKWKSLYIVSSDYHIPRVKEIFDFILGTGFYIEYQSIESGRINDDATLEDQKRSLEKFKNLFFGVKSGKDLEIEERLKNKHKLYGL